MPFTDEQVADIIEVCDRINDYKASPKWGNRYGSGAWTGEDLKDFIWLMTYTGLRISDVVLFDMERLHGNEVFLRAKKNGGNVFAVIPDWLRDRLLARAKRCGNQPFMVGGSKRLDTVIDVWRQRLAKVFELADIGTEKATPHRFRHTFARILLQKGVSAADVADLMGDDEKTIKTHYAFWVTEKQAAPQCDPARRLQRQAKAERHSRRAFVVARGRAVGCFSRGRESCLISSLETCRESMSLRVGRTGRAGTNADCVARGRR